jgi:hypothetical protein
MIAGVPAFELFAKREVRSYLINSEMSDRRCASLIRDFGGAGA